MKKKLLALMLLALIALPALAGSGNILPAPPAGPVNPYGLGLETLPPKSRSGYAEVTTIQEPVLGGEGEWSVWANGATQYEFHLCPYDDTLSVQQTCFIQRYSASNTFSYTFYEAGEYLLFIYMKDSSGSSWTDYYFFTVADAPGVVTIDSRVKEIVAECRGAVSGEYETALWLHDWITHHAYYDRTYTNYGPDGILFRGTGVCDSYSKLYLRLLTEAGIESIRVTGTANGGGHAWNAAKIDGAWCQIDVTWDDPAGSSNAVSGQERYDYFGLSDEFMSLDHTYTPEVACDTLANYQPYRVKQYRTWLYHVLPEIEANLAAGQTSFDVDTEGRIIGEVVDGSPAYWYVDTDYVNEKSALCAAMMSLETWAGPDGQTVRATFTYDSAAQTMHVEAEAQDESMWAYTVDGEACTITGYTGAGGDVVIPATLGGKSVTAIDDYAFYSCTRLKKITIPDSVTSISSWGVFHSCTGLTSVTLPSGLTRIGGEMFKNCSSLASITIPDSVTEIGAEAFYGCASLTSIEIPDGVTYLSAGAFQGCTGLTEVTLPSSLTELSEDLFADCTSLTEITIPEGVTRIEDSFFGCTGLTTVSIPSSVTNIRYDTFYCCTSLTTIQVSEQNEVYTSVDNVLMNKAQTEIVCYPGGRGGAYDIPSGVTSIGEYAFSGCVRPIEITIPDSMTSIGSSAFQRCAGLTSVAIPDSVTSIGENAFSGCASLTSITIPESVTSIGNGAFSGCASLTSTTIPESVTSIGDGAFRGCTSLTEIALPDSVTSIERYVFTGCTSLSFVMIPESVTTIQFEAFSGCVSLTEITIPSGVTTISQRAFADCTSLAEIMIPESVTTIGFGAFNNCSPGLLIICYEGSAAETYALENNFAYTVLTHMFEPDLFLPASLTAIESQAFAGVAAESVFIPYTVTSIAEDAFEGSAIHTIQGFPGTAAETFANEHGFTFVPIDYM